MIYIWTANFGVVPLFLLAAFLFEPLVFALRRLIIFVLFVHDAITHSDKIKKAVLYLPDTARYVKAIFRVLTLLFLWCDVSLSKNNEETLILAKGEQIEIKVNGLTKFSIGNKEILSTKIESRNKSIFLKGKTMGFTDLILWETKNTRHFLVYVISKKHHLDQAKISEIFPPPRWNVSFEGDDLSLRGQILFTNEWNIIQKLILQGYRLRIDDVTLHHSIRRRILKNTYSKLKNMGLENYQCYISEIPYVDCILKRSLNTQELTALREQLQFHRFISKNTLESPKNIRAKLKIIAFDIQEGQSWDKGFDYIKGNLHQLIHGSFYQMIKNNPVLFKSLWNHAQILSEPEFSILPPSEAQFSAGSEIPYTHNNESESVTSWKFAGLLVSIKIEKSTKPNEYTVTYSTELTSPQDQIIQGHKQSAKMLIGNNSNVLLFDISFQAISALDTGLPFWNKFPILKDIFGSKENVRTRKKIMALMHLEQE